MVIGIGVDILRISDLLTTSLAKTDPFFKNTYAKEEHQQAEEREVPYFYYATRFAGKEAVFKSLGVSSDRIKLNEIIILDDENGQPHVRLIGNLLERAKEKGIGEILISLSYEKDYAIAYATAQSLEWNVKEE